MPVKVDVVNQYELNVCKILQRNKNVLFVFTFSDCVFCLQNSRGHE